MKKLTTLLLLFFATTSLFAQGLWTKMADFGGGSRIGAVTFSIGHYVYMGMGWSAPNTYVSDFWRWDQHTNTWSQIASLPGMSRISGLAFVIGDTAYVGFGQNGATILGDLYAYDTTTNTWSARASLSSYPRLAPFVFVVNNKAYIGTGSQGGTPYLQDLWEFDPTVNTWTQKANFPGGMRSGTIGFSEGNYGYAGCGYDGSNTYNDMYQYNPRNNTWTAINNIPYATGFFVPLAFVLGNKAYVGTGRSAASGGIWIKDYFAYDTNTKSWSQIANIPMPRYAGGIEGASCGGKGYVGTGYDSLLNYQKDFWQYDPSPAGINEVEAANNSVNVYPNPSNGLFRIQAKSQQLMTNSTLEVYNMLGEKIYSNTFNIKNLTFNIDLSNNAEGIYLYRLTGNNGALIGEGKLIIQK